MSDKKDWWKKSHIVHFTDLKAVPQKVATQVVLSEHLKFYKSLAEIEQLKPKADAAVDPHANHVFLTADMNVRVNVTAKLTVVPPAPAQPAAQVEPVMSAQPPEPSLGKLTRLTAWCPRGLKKDLRAMIGDYEPEIAALRGAGRPVAAFANMGWAWVEAVKMMARSPLDALLAYFTPASKGE